MSLQALAPSHDRLGAVHLSGLVFLLYASVSIAWSQSPVYGLVLLASLAISYILGSVITNHRTVWFCFILFVIFNSCLCLFGKTQRLDLTYGVLGNANVFGCALALAVAAALAYRMIWFVPLGVGGLVYTQSRGAMLAAGFACAWYALDRRKVLFAVAALVCAVIAVYFFRDISGEFRANGVLARAGIWQSTLNHLSFFGFGFGSFSEAYAQFPVRINMTEFRPMHVYNDFLEMTFDLGIGVVFLWVLLILLIEQADAKTRLISYTFFVLALTYFPTYIPIVGQLFAFELGKQGEDNGTVAVKG